MAKSPVLSHEKACSEIEIVGNSKHTLVTISSSSSNEEALKKANSNQHAIQTIFQCGVTSIKPTNMIVEKDSVK